MLLRLLNASRMWLGRAGQCSISSGDGARHYERAFLAARLLLQVSSFAVGVGCQHDNSNNKNNI